MDGRDASSQSSRNILAHWVRPELVAEVKFLTWTDDNLLRQVVYEGLRGDKPAREVQREVPHPAAATSTPVRPKQRD